MNFAVAVLFLCLNTSQANTIKVQPASIFQKHLELKTQIVTKNALAFAASRAQRKLLAAVNLVEDENDDLPGPSELDLQIAYTRPRLIENRLVFDLNDEVSDYVAARLALAREKAMEKYHEIWG